MKKFLTLLLAAFVAVSALSFTACGNKKDENKIYVGMECGYAPFNYNRLFQRGG